MDDLSNKSCLVYDHGQFCDLATRLSREFGKVYYFNPWKKFSPDSRLMMVGDGMDNVEKVKDFFEVIDTVDLFVFPGLFDSDLQLYLESLGKRVWGSREAGKLEYMRELFKDTLDEVGLPVIPFEVIIGVPSLREYLKENEGQVIKISLCRGDGETWKCPNYKMGESQLDAMEKYYGPAKHEIRFVVEKAIESDIEIGYDGICIDGEFTDGFVDYEIKNEACIAAVRRYSDMNDTVRDVNSAFSEKLRQARCRSQWGTEIIVDKKGVGYFIDATARMPSPPGELQLELISNLGEIFYHGALGDFVQIEPTAKFGVELMIYSCWEDLAWTPISIPDDSQQWIKLSTYCKVDGLYYPICHEGHEHIPWYEENIGCSVGIGDTMEDAVEMAIEHANSIEGHALKFNEMSIGKALARAQEGESKGIEFSDEAIPKPSTVMES